MHLVLLLFLFKQFVVNEATRWEIFPLYEHKGGNDNRIYLLYLSWGDGGPWRRITVGDYIDIAKTTTEREKDKNALKSVSKKHTQRSQLKAPIRKNKNLGKRGPHKSLAEKEAEKEAESRLVKALSDKNGDPWKRWSYRGIVRDNIAEDTELLQLKDTRGSEGHYVYVHYEDLEAALNDGRVQIRLQDTITKKASSWDPINAPNAQHCWINKDAEGFPDSSRISAEGVEWKEPPTGAPDVKFPPGDIPAPGMGTKGTASEAEGNHFDFEKKRKSAYNEYENEFEYDEYDEEQYAELLHYYEELVDAFEAEQKQLKRYNRGYRVGYRDAQQMLKKKYHI